MSTETLRYEDAAEPAAIFNAEGQKIDDGWISKRTHTYWSNKHSSAEHMARYTDATDSPCDTEGCTGRHDRGYTLCAVCRQRKEDDSWRKRLAENAVDWDGTTPLAIDGSDTFFWDADAVQDYLDERQDEGAALEDIRLVICEPDNAPAFEMIEHLADHLPEDAYLDDAEINRTVNAWIKERSPFCWWATTTPVRHKSLKNLFVERAEK